MVRILLMMLVVCLLALPAAASDVTGKWSGTIELKGPEGDRTMPVVLVLKQNGTEITGTGGGSEDDQHPIKNGKIDGDNLNFEVHQERESGSHVFRLALKLVGEKLEGTINRDNEEMIGKLSATKKAE